MHLRTLRIQRDVRLTIDGWARLPFLLPRSVVLEWTGLTRRELEALVRAGQLTTFGTGKKRKWFKTQIGLLIGLQLPTSSLTDSQRSLIATHKP